MTPDAGGFTTTSSACKMGEGMCRREGFLVRASRRKGSGRGTTKASPGVRFLRKSGRSEGGSGDIPPAKAQIAKSRCSARFRRTGRGEAAA